MICFCFLFHVLISQIDRRVFSIRRSRERFHFRLNLGKFQHFMVICYSISFVCCNAWLIFLLRDQKIYIKHPEIIDLSSIEIQVYFSWSFYGTYILHTTKDFICVLILCTVHCSSCKNVCVFRQVSG